VTDPSTETSGNETPILDRQAPLPPRAAPGSGLSVVLAVWLGLALLLAAGWFLNEPPGLRRWLLADVRPWLVDQFHGAGVVMFALSAIAAFYLMLVVHELGHVAAGFCAGFRCRSLRIGPVLVNRPFCASLSRAATEGLPVAGLTLETGRPAVGVRGRVGRLPQQIPFRVSLYRGPGAVVQGIAEVIPVATRNLAWRGVVTVLGGPLANIVSATLVLLAPFPITLFSGLFVACSLVNGLNDLLPFESRLGVSDGRRIWMLLRQPARGERWLALLYLGGQLDDGVLPELLSADFLAKAIAVRDASADTVQANAIACSAAFHQQHDSEAANRLETCLAFSGHATPVLREALMSDAAVLQARRRKRPDVAEQWLAEIPVKTQHPWLRTRAEAAILDARGDVAGAARKLAELEATILALPANARRDVSLRLLERWKAELCSVSEA